MTGNKILGSSAPRAVFVLFGGNGGPLFSRLHRPPSFGVWPRPRGWRSACAGGRQWPNAGGSSIGPALLSPRPLCARIGSALGARPLATRHGVSAPASLRAVSGHRLGGGVSSPRVGWCARVTSGRALGLYNRCGL